MRAHAEPNDAGIRHILVRHEAEGGHAAEGYAQAIRRLGVAPQRAGVFEDSSGGIAAAIASGAGTVIRVGTGEPGPGQAAVVADLRSVGWLDGLVLLPDDGTA